MGEGDTNIDQPKLKSVFIIKAFSNNNAQVEVFKSNYIDVANCQADISQLSIPIIYN